MSTETLSSLHPRILLDFTEHPFAGQLFLGRYYQSKATPGLKPHRHANAMEICYLAKGMQVYEVGQRRYVMTGNDIYVTFPDEEHSSGDFPQEKATLYWLQVGFPEPGTPYLSLTDEYARPLLERLRAIPRRVFHGNWNVQRRFEEAFAAYFAPPTSLHDVTLATRVIELLLEILHCAELPEATRRPDDITLCLTYIEEHLEQQITLERLAGQMGLSLSRCKTKFKQAVGIPPAEYILRRKIERARVLLRQEHASITAIAYALGFSSSQYFATVFKRYTNLRPGEYRRRERTQNAEAG